VASDAPLRFSPTSHLCVVGLGLVGGSICRAARLAFPGVRIVGVDREGILAAALDGAVIDTGVVASDHDAVDAALRNSEGGAVILALPVLSVVEMMDRHADTLRPVFCMDTGSTKGGVVAAARRLGLGAFVGGHPMAGKSSGGLAHADPQLFDGASWFLCADDGTDLGVIAGARAFVRGIGAVPVEIDAADHDRDVALTSHLPHLLANVLAEAVLAAGATDAAGGSLRDVMKVAGAPIDVWGDTVSTNAEAIGDALDDLMARLQTLRAHLHDKERVRELFAHGRALKERLHD